MKTLQQLAAGWEQIPATTAWYLADLGESRGKQELFTRQSPQRLKVLREHALIESAVSSNRIEGVTVDRRRIGTLVFGTPLLRDRNEEEVKGYRDALQLIHERAAKLPATARTIRMLHRMVRGRSGDAGQYKAIESDIIERSSDGRQRVRFQTVAAVGVLAAMEELDNLWRACLEERQVHPLIAMAAHNLDFLCIHPFRDGNGRVSRLLLLLQCYHLGYEVGRYISLERLIEQNKERYYETLEQCSTGWHHGKHDPWPYVNFILFVLKMAYREFERRVGEVHSPRGAKTELVQHAVRSFSGLFTLTDLERACPSVSRDMIRKILRALRTAGEVRCLGRGPGAKWQRRGTTLKRRYQRG